MRWFLRASLLIASAIQGITPDARDLSSPFVFRHLLASSPDRVDFRDESDHSDEICLAVVQRTPLQDRQQHAGSRSRSAFLMETGPAPGSTPAVLAVRRNPARGITPGLGLFEALCRLLC
jgi:hypothetical protein